MNNSDHPVAPDLIEGIAILHDGTGALWVAPPEGAEIKTFEPFRLPRIESMQLAWLGGLADAYFAKTRRCLAVMLLLDVTSQQWSWCLPRQKCGSEAACWQPNRHDGFVINANQRLAGVFQSVAVADPAEVPGCVPPITGIHILGHYWNQDRGVWGFVRFDDSTLMSMEPHELSSDNLDQVLETNRLRMQIV